VDQRRQETAVELYSYHKFLISERAFAYAHAEFRAPHATTDSAAGRLTARAMSGPQSRQSFSAFLQIGRPALQ
jgi:hypothetical protein